MRNINYDAVENFHQPRNAYRFSQDSIALAEFVSAENAYTLMDLGAGCGVLGLCALEKGKAGRAKNLFFVEREAVFLPYLQKNLDLYQAKTSCRLHLVHNDWNCLADERWAGQVDYIMVNPPFFAAAASRASKNPVIDRARREEPEGLSSLLKSMKKLLRCGGKAALVMPLSREKDLLSLLEKYCLIPERNLKSNNVFFLELIK